jgi:hypothetical protein
MELKFKGGEEQRERLSLSLSHPSFHSQHTIYSSAVNCLSLNGEPRRILGKHVTLLSCRYTSEDSGRGMSDIKKEMSEG